VILVTGGSGFVGGHVVHALRAAGQDVRCLVRDRRRGERLEAWGCELVEGDVTDPESLRLALAGCDTVVHLVAIRQGKQEAFQRIMIDGTRNVIAAARDAGVGRFVLMSALGTTEETKDVVPYYGAKWQMEQDVKAAGIPYVIFRPSFIFAKDGGILPTFAKLARLARDADHRQRHAADPADLGRRRRRVLREGGRARHGRGPHVRDRRPDAVSWNEFWERLKSARRSAAEHPHADRAHEGERTRHRASARRHPAHARPAEDARGRRQRRHRPSAADVFGLPLVPLDEQLRRTA
jgi:uncharacterized protein YbjT (DUF2867 family)